MIILRVFLSGLLALSGINDTGKFFEEAAKTFKMFEKSKSDIVNSSKTQEVQETENSELISSDTVSKDCSVSDENIGPKSNDDGVSSQGVSSKSKENNTVSKKIENASEGYKKSVLKTLHTPLQLQKFMYSIVKPVSEFLGAGYIMCGYTPKGSAFSWLDLFGGKGDPKFLELE